ncbi:hypothetical protein LSAT2_020415 [Lamellibrachia satsuma]|nr:hypothetical protein LSAT2_020415 [Lamellibrachia satsuma]
MMRVKVQFNLLVTCLVMTSLETSLTTAVKDPTNTDLLPFFRCYSACNDQFVHCKVRCIMSGGNDTDYIGTPNYDHLVD